MAGVQIEGARQLRATLKRAGGDLQDLRAANRRAATTVVPAAAALAPKRSGALAASVRAGATTRAGVVRAGKKRVPYAGPVHWGWPSRPDPARGIRGGPIKPHPFLMQAAQDTEPQWVPIYEAEIISAIRKVKGKK